MTAVIANTWSVESAAALTRVAASAGARLDLRAACFVVEVTHQTVVELFSNDAVAASGLHSNVDGAKRVPPLEKMQTNGASNPLGLVFSQCECAGSIGIPTTNRGVDSTTSRTQRGRKIVFVVRIPAPVHLRL